MLKSGYFVAGKIPGELRQGAGGGPAPHGTGFRSQRAVKMGRQVSLGSLNCLLCRCIDYLPC